MFDHVVKLVKEDLEIGIVPFPQAILVKDNKPETIACLYFRDTEEKKKVFLQHLPKLVLARETDYVILVLPLELRLFYFKGGVEAAKGVAILKITANKLELVAVSKSDSEVVIQKVDKVFQTSLLKTTIDTLKKIWEKMN